MHRSVAIAILAATVLGGCAELGVISDGTSISVGKPSRGHLIEGRRLPDRGEGFTTKAIWKQRDNRYGTDELIDLVTAVGRGLAAQGGVKLVIADLSVRGGGEAKKWHRSHQSGRDVDLVYFQRDKDGASFEADAMRVFDPTGTAKDGSGITVDIPRMWKLIKALVTAHEATVQWAFIYEPIAVRILEHAAQLGEPEELLVRARLVMKQPGDSAPHNDHIHVRVYCSDRDRLYGCLDYGPMEPMAERIAARERDGDFPSMVASMLSNAAHTAAAEVLATEPTATAAAATVTQSEPRTLRSLARFYLRSWF